MSCTCGLPTCGFCGNELRGRLPDPILIRAVEGVAKRMTRKALASWKGRLAAAIFDRLQADDLHIEHAGETLEIRLQWHTPEGTARVTVGAGLREVEAGRFGPNDALEMIADYLGRTDATAARAVRRLIGA